MQLNLKSSTTGDDEVIGFRLYKETVEALDLICKENKLKRSVLLRHIVNEYLDGVK
tara:strand:- start:4010 stop:4177 length:168 start_codon:yes stop_codon:yes gene_type:complete